jgi:poly(3-hydroxybutyrate) depolymerase
VYHRFESLYEGRGTYDPMKADFTGMERDILVIYGDPDATQEQIDGGDGGHVGSVPQMINRLLTMVKFVSDRWPDGDREPVSGMPARSEQSSYASAAAGREIDYLVYLPPGYDREGTSYPVLYLLHGLGMSPFDLQVADYLIELYMSDGRLQKFIVIYPDAQCLPEECNDGNFYIHQAGGWVDGKDYESAFVDDLIAHVDATYKTRAPETFDVE